MSINIFKQVQSELQRGMRLSRCRKCGCMKGTLENLKVSLPALKKRESKALLKDVNSWIKQLEPVEYACFGCKFCIPPEAMTLLTSRFPELASSTLSSCGFEADKGKWPPVEGEYTVLDRSAPVALSTLSSTRLEEKLVIRKPSGLCIVGKTETENIGIDKIIKNVITNPVINHLILAGKDTEGHQSGGTLLALWKNGVNKDMRVIGSNGRRPILKNVSTHEVNTFRKQVKIEDMTGCENIRTLTGKIKELSGKSAVAVGKPDQYVQAGGCGCHDCGDQKTPLKFLSGAGVSSPKITAQKHSKSSIELDKAGYFVIIPSKGKKTITAEHYSYDNRLLRSIEGKSSRDIYLTIISNKWIKNLSHAAYIGKELARAELSIRKGFKFVQDGA
jgi:tetrahydromethanopterin S-methyltransferase subunit A